MSVVHERESNIEAYLRDRVKVCGGKAYKWVSPGNRGVPDRIVMLPTGRMFLIELKATGEKPTKAQLGKHNELRKLGFSVLIIDSKAKVDQFIQERCKSLPDIIDMDDPCPLN